MDAPARRKASAVFWIVALLGLIWNAFGALDFVLTNLRAAEYMANFPPGYVQYIDAFPPWVTALWALGVGAALAGSLLLLARSRWAVHAFAVSLACLAGSLVYHLGADLPAGAKTPMMVGSTLAVWAIAILLLLGSIRWRRQGVLR